MRFGKYIRIAIFCALAVQANAADTDALDKSYRALMSQFVEFGRQVEGQSRLDSDVILFGIEPKAEFTLDSVDFLINGKSYLSHQYSLKELEALNTGGLQTLYQNPLRAGRYKVTLKYSGSLPTGDKFAEKAELEITASAKKQTIIELQLKDKGKRPPKLVKDEH